MANESAPDEAMVVVTPSRRWLVDPAIAAALAVSVAWVFRDLRQDDAFITFQFARNVASGQGFGFNPGERVLGVTSPLSVLVHAGIYGMGGDALPEWAVLLGALSLAVQVLLLFRIVQRSSVALAWMVSALVVAGYAGSYPLLSMETNLFAALVLGVLLSLEARRDVLCGMLLGFAFLCRYDAALLIPICLLTWRWRFRVWPIRLLLVSAVVVAPWLLWAQLYFGSFLPQTFFAKQQITDSRQYLAMALTRFARTPWGLIPTSMQQGLQYLTPLFWASGFVFALRHARQTLGFCVFGLGLLLSYAWIGPHPDQHWHLYSAELMFALLTVFGTCGWFLVRHSSSATPRRFLVPEAAVASLFLLASVAAPTVAFAKSYRTDFWFGKRHARYVEVSEWLTANVRSTSVMADPEIGTIGYLSRLRMVDPYGLINATNDFPQHPDIERLADFVEASIADVVLVNSFDEGLYLERRSSFRMVKRFDWDPWSTILVRGPEALKDPTAFDALRARLTNSGRSRSPASSGRE